MTAALDWRFVEDGREIRVASTPRFATNSSDAAIQYAEADGGLTRVMAYQAAESLKAGRLKIVLATFEQPAMPIHIVYPTSRLLSAKVRTFIDLVTEIGRLAFRLGTPAPSSAPRETSRWRARSRRRRP